MYYVYSHRYGIKASISPNGLLYEHDLAGHQWEGVSRHRKKAEAIAACDAVPFHARVHDGPATSEFIHDNGKKPGNRIKDQRPDKSVPIRAPRGLECYGLEGELAFTPPKPAAPGA